jgi:Nitroreductase
MEKFADLVRRARSCRRFVENEPVGSKTLREIIDCVRVTTSARNRQPLRYIAVSDAQTRLALFAHTNWASVLGWGGPPPGERPTGFIVMLSVSPPSMPVYYDTGIAAQTMQLYAASMGVGCCILNNFPRDPVREILNIPEELHIMLLLGFGIPKEDRRVLEAEAGDDLQYWRDESGVHYVPKLSLNTVLLDER